MSDAAALAVVLAERTAEAVCAVLETFTGAPVEAGRASIVATGTNPLGTLPIPAVVTNASYADGVSGGNVFAITVAGARQLAKAMMGAEVDSSAEELSELALSAVSEAANQMLATVAATTSSLLGQDVEVDPPETRMLTDQDEPVDAHGATLHVTSVSFDVGGQPGRLVQLIPQSFIARMSIALAEKASEARLGDLDTGPAADGAPGDWLSDTPLRLVAELGRTQLPVDQVVTLGDGAIVSLDRRATDPIDLYVNGAPFATGRLLLLEDGDWAVRIEGLVQAD